MIGDEAPPSGSDLVDELLTQAQDHISWARECLFRDEAAAAMRALASAWGVFVSAHDRVKGMIH